jgi:putative phage-type endonuclease
MKIYKDLEQGSDDWLKIRLGKITGSRVKDVFKADNLSLVDELISELVTEQIEDNYESEDMIRGKTMEPIARRAYEELMNCKVEKVGFISSGKYPWLGYSPDGLIMNGEHYYKGIEIKCPRTKNHVKTIRQNKVPAEYKPQVLLIFLIAKHVEEVDFITYDNRFYIRPIHIVNVKRSECEEDLKEMEATLLKFWNKFEKYYNDITF